jgi:hypothetical protein
MLLKSINLKMSDTLKTIRCEVIEPLRHLVIKISLIALLYILLIELPQIPHLL